MVATYKLTTRETTYLKPDSHILLHLNFVGGKNPFFLPLPTFLLGTYPGAWLIDFYLFLSFEFFKKFKITSFHHENGKKRIKTGPPQWSLNPQWHWHWYEPTLNECPEQKPSNFLPFYMRTENKIFWPTGWVGEKISFSHRLYRKVTVTC